MIIHLYIFKQLYDEKANLHKSYFLMIDKRLCIVKLYLLKK